MSTGVQGTLAGVKNNPYSGRPLTLRTHIHAIGTEWTWERESTSIYMYMYSASTVGQDISAGP